MNEGLADVDILAVSQLRTISALFKFSAHNLQHICSLKTRLTRRRFLSTYIVEDFRKFEAFRNLDVWLASHSFRRV